MSAPVSERRLHPLQIAVVEHRGSNLVVEAGAGTGKTETLSLRAVSLLADGSFLPHQLWVCSFTRSAAAGIKQRVCEQLFQGQFCTFGTLHSLALRVIRRHGSVAEILSRQKQVDLIRSLLNCLSVKLPSGVKASRIAELFSLELNTGVSLQSLCQKENLSQYTSQIQLVQQQLFAYQEEHQLLDYDGIILECLRLMELFGDRVAKRDCKHLLIDEAQDLSCLQLDLVAAFAAAGIEITAVGDRMQAIYGWRGSDPDAMLQFSGLPGRWSRLVLTQNYRCPECVLQVANSLSARQRGVCLKSGIQGGRVLSFRYPSEQSEADGVAVRIADLLNRGVDPAEIVVLYRSSLHSLKLQESLKRLGIAFSRHGGLQYESAALGHLAALLRLSLRADPVAVQQVLQLCPGIGSVKAKQLSDQWPDCKVPLRAVERFESLRCCLASLRVAATSGQIWQLAVDWLGEAINLADLESVSESFLAEPFRDGLGFIRNWLDSVAVDPVQDQGCDPKVALATVHWFKGKERAHVFCIGCTVGRFVRPGNFEDERLLFVSLTRSTGCLEISSPEFHFNGKTWAQGVPCLEAV